MYEITDWLETQSLANLARYAKKPIQDLRKIIVTEAMTEAAMDYIYSLHDSQVTTFFLEEVFRIMAALQPKALEGQEQCPQHVLVSHQNLQKLS